MQGCFYVTQILENKNWRPLKRFIKISFTVKWGDFTYLLIKFCVSTSIKEKLFMKVAQMEIIYEWKADSLVIDFEPKEEKVNLK